MKNLKRAQTLLLLFVLTMAFTFTTGCGKKSDVTDTIAVTVGEHVINLNEMMYYIYAIEASGENYETYYQTYYGTSYWDLEYTEGVTMRDQTKTYIMDTVVLYEILYDKALEAGYTITDDEKSEAETNADAVMEQISEEQLAITGFNKEILLTIQEKLIIGQKYYEDLTTGFDIDRDKIASEFNIEDYRQYDTEYVFVATSTYDTSYQIIELSDEEKAVALETITGALEKAKAGESFSDIVAEDETMMTNTISFIYGDTNADVAYEDAAIKLENDEIASSVIETSIGYYIIKMLDNNSTESYDSAVEEAVSLAEEEAFNAEYEVIKKDYTITINNEAWDPIVMGKTTIIADTEE